MKLGVDMPLFLSLREETEVGGMLRTGGESDLDSEFQGYVERYLREISE